MSTTSLGGTFIGAPAKVVTGVVGAPIKGVAKVGGGMMKGASFISRGVRGKSSSNTNTQTFEQNVPDIPNAYQDTEVREEPAAVPQTPGDTATDGSESPTRLKTPNNRDSGSGLSPYGTHRSNRSISGASSVMADQGVASITLVSATGFPDKSANFQVHIKAVGRREKDVHKSRAIKNANGEPIWDESFIHACPADQQFAITVKDHSTFKDHVLGEGMLVVDDTGRGGETVVNCGPGKVMFKTSFKLNDMREAPASLSKSSGRKSLFRSRGTERSSP